MNTRRNRGKIDPRVIGEIIAEKFKNAGTGNMAFQDIQKTILEVLESSGVEIPEKVKQAIKDYQPPTQG